MLLVVEFLVSMRDESRRRLFQVYCKGEYGINCGSKSMSLASQKGHHSHASSFIKHPVRPPLLVFVIDLRVLRAMQRQDRIHD